MSSSRASVISSWVAAEMTVCPPWAADISRAVRLSVGPK
jgi:hypothetical protein